MNKYAKPLNLTLEQSIKFLKEMGFYTEEEAENAIKFRKYLDEHELTDEYINTFMNAINSALKPTKVYMVKE